MQWQYRFNWERANVEFFLRQTIPRIFRILMLMPYRFHRTFLHLDTCTY